ncbi:MAG: hypothetical protein H6736_03380 [Alphaproteobacteria bacterium]|nr:hypothetical protein [Alphaproteobacteria bacterium]MCB9690837.1 hypothetical protein [Alphaproteobacteria bacterium]
MAGLTREELTNLAVGLPIVTAIVGAAAGLALGFILGWTVKPERGPSDEQVARMAIDAFTPDQITFKCGQVRGEELQTANARIALLQAERNEFEGRVKRLQAELEAVASTPAPPSVPRDPGIAREASRLQRELDAARRQLDDVRQELARAEAEKAQLQQALVATTAQLERAEVALGQESARADRAEDEALSQAWQRFLGAAQLDICERGNRKKLGRCREDVTERLTAPMVRQAFSHCVRSRQATPAVALLPRGESLPRYAQFLDQESKVTHDWYVQLCDPTLPEARMGR